MLEILLILSFGMAIGFITGVYFSNHKIEFYRSQIKELQEEAQSISDKIDFSLNQVKTLEKEIQYLRSK